MPKCVPRIILSLGANLTSVAGSPADTLNAAIVSLEGHGAVIRATSKFYHTPAFPAGNGPDYINAALECTAQWSPKETLEVLHDIEHEFGRARIQRWGQRTLDIDLIAYDAVVLPDPVIHAQWRALSLDAQMTHSPDRLILPHPRMQDRAFVLVPMADIAPDWRHPIFERTVAQMRDALPQADTEAVREM